MARLLGSLAALAWRPCAGEAPPGAVPSIGTESWYADYELRFRPEDAGAQPLPWRLSAWQFQEHFVDFILGKGRPPLNAAYFVAVTLPDDTQQQIFKECPGLVLTAVLLVAQARLSAGACLEADALVQKAWQWMVQSSGAAAGQQAAFHEVPRRVAPGWHLEAASQSFLEARPGCPAAAARKPLLRCEEVKLDVVVAFCNEDLRWLADFADARLWLYAKCALPHLPQLALPCVTVEQLPNQGMESLAYAAHLERRHGNFAKFTMFLQGKPFEHAPRALIGDALSAVHVDIYDVPFLHLNMRRFLAGSSLCLRDAYARLFEADMPEVLGSYCCNQFLVRSDRLLSHGRTFYQKLQGILSGEIPLACAQDVNYDARPGIAVSALFEHLWHVIFGEAAVLAPRRSNPELPLFARIDTAEGELPNFFAPDSLDA